MSNPPDRPALRRGLYAITNGPRPDLLTVSEAVLEAGARALQYRDDSDDTDRRRLEASALAALCARFDVPLIVEGDIVLAARCGAHGVHLSEPEQVGDARRQLGEHALIGVSCRASLESARRAAEGGADYVSFGAFFASATLPHAGRADPALLRHSEPLGLPRVAIGGVTPDNGRSLLEAGADMLAAIDAVFGADDPAREAHRFAALFPPQASSHA